MGTSSTTLALGLGLLLLFQSSVAQFPFGSPQRTSPRLSGYQSIQQQCRFEHLAAIHPSRQERSEAGFIEYYNTEARNEFPCAGVNVKRIVVERAGLLLPAYANAPQLLFIVQGRGVFGLALPGCPATFQSVGSPFGVEGEGRASQKIRDEHQQLHHFQKGDVIAVPAGVAHWLYNNGESPVVAVTVVDTSNSANQLDPSRREFFLAGNARSRQQQQQPEYSYQPQAGFQQQPPEYTYEPQAGLQQQPPEYSYQPQAGQQQPEYPYQPQTQQQNAQSIFAGFSPVLLAEALGVSRQTAARLQSRNDQRGPIIRVRGGFQALQPSLRGEPVHQIEAQGAQGQGYFPVGGQIQSPWFLQPQGSQSPWSSENGLDENVCSLKIRKNIDHPQTAHIFNPRAGRISRANAQNFPILNIVQMSATSTVLQSNALLTPHWSLNAHTVMYVTAGQGYVQVVDNRGRNVFNGQLCQSQILLIPQNFVVTVKAQQQGFAWVSFKTNHNAIDSQIAGKGSILRALPVDVIANAYRLSRIEARSLKFNRGDEMAIFAPRRGQQSYPYPGFQPMGSQQSYPEFAPRGIEQGYAESQVSPQ